MLTAALLVLLALVLLCFVCIGHQHNEIQTLTRRVNAAHFSIQVLAERKPPTIEELFAEQRTRTVDAIGQKVLAAHAARRSN